jgi:hypothetical protein
LDGGVTEFRRAVFFVPVAVFSVPIASEHGWLGTRIGADERTRHPAPALRARAGVTGHNVRYVLAFGLIAVVAAFLIVYLVYV